MPAEDYLLKLAPDAGREGGYRLSYVTPSDYEIHDDDTITTPEGRKLTWKAFDEDAFSAPDEPLYSPPEEVTEEKLAMPDYEPSFAQADLDGRQAQMDDEYRRLREVFGRVYTRQDLREIMDYAYNDPAGFVGDLREHGRDGGRRVLLKSMFPVDRR
jgi:hypothetical protein